MASARRPLRANIVSWDGGGLGTDIDILSAALARAGCEVTFKGRMRRRITSRAHSLMLTFSVLVAQRWAALTSRPQFDVNFFIESVFPEYLPQARVNGLFVNPEWFRDSNLPHVGRLDVLLCKAPSAVEAVKGLPARARSVGFTSPDKRLPGFIREGPIHCLHLSGQSAVKGTEAVVEAWSRHPEWPQLTVVRRAKRYGAGEAPPLPALPNVTYETDFVPEERLRRLQNECEIHVIPSLAEGYGHVIGEAMSCGVVVVTTDAAPMNELVRPDRGLLVRVARSEKQYLSALNYVDVSDLESQLNTAFSMTPDRRREIGNKARAWFEAQDQSFERALREFLDDVGQQPATPSESREPRTEHR
jgi:glycosyltransferase involved in cell wall biosynthesis